MIRIGTEQDIDNLIKLKTRVSIDTYGDYGTKEALDCWIDTFCTEKYFIELLAKGATILIAEYEDTLLGMAAFNPEEYGFKFGDLYTGLQGRGIGSLLTQHRFSMVQNYADLELPGMSFELRARCFYQNHRAYLHLLKHGFTPFDWENNMCFNCPSVWMSKVVINTPNP